MVVFSKPLHVLASVVAVSHGFKDHKRTGKQDPVVVDPAFDNAVAERPPAAADADFTTDAGAYSAKGKWKGEHEDTTRYEGIAGTVMGGLDSVADALTGKQPTYEIPPPGSSPLSHGNNAVESEHAEIRAEKKAAVTDTMKDAMGAPSAPHIAAQKYIPQTCEEICADQCTPTGIFSEIAQGVAKVADTTTGLTPNPVREAGYDVGEYFGDIVHELIPGSFLQTFASKKTGKKSSKNLLKRRAGSSDCIVECHNMVNQCADQMDFPDQVPQTTEEYTIKPRMSQCEDLMKLHFIAKSGNLKWSMRFGQSPTFKQIAGLTEPMHLITEDDLRVLSTCAEGGDFAVLNLDAAKGLASCMAGETQGYAKDLAAALKGAHMKMVARKQAEMKRRALTEGNLAIPEAGSKPAAAFVQTSQEPAAKDAPKVPEVGANMDPAAPTEKQMPVSTTPHEAAGLNPLVAEGAPSPSEEAQMTPAEKAAWELSEESFYVNDLRCFQGCPQLSYSGLLKECDGDATNCFSDFADLMWRTGVLSSDMSIGKALHGMHDVHANDPALQPDTGASILDPTTWFGNTQIQDPNTEAADYISLKQDKKATKQAPPTGEYDAATDATSPLYRPHQSSSAPPPPFCKAQMCAPFPAMWIHEPLTTYLSKSGDLDLTCAAAIPPAEMAEADNHPHEVYEGVVEEGSAPAEAVEPAAETVLAITGKMPLSAQAKNARHKAMERRARAWKHLVLAMKKQ